MAATIALRGACAPVLQPSRYVSKEAFLLEASRGRKVLHLGCVGFTDLRPDERVKAIKNSLHFKLSQVADVTVVDRSVDVIKECQRSGLLDNVVPGDVERLGELSLPSPFDLVVAGDIIEHLSNPGMMLDGIRGLCTPGTPVIVTTPNALGIPNYARFVLRRFSEGAEHVLSFNATTLTQLLERHRFRVIQIETCFQPLTATARGTMFNVTKRALEWMPRFGGTLLVVAVLRAH